MRLEVQMIEVSRAQVNVAAAVDRVETQLQGRPAWNVVWMIAGLQALVGILVTALVYQLGR